ncbi:MAG: DUF4377 domain-containing protein [Bacteroidota bacterium]
MRKTVFLFSMLLGFCLNTFAQEPIIKTWIVADARMACTVGDAVTSCYRIKEHVDSNWIQFPWTIDGFLHDKGTEYIIEVQLEKIPFTEKNGPEYTYTLKRIVSQKNNVLTDKRLLANNKFQLINIEEYGKLKLAIKSKAFLKFNIDSNIIEGFSGCNNLKVSCSFATAFLQFGPMVADKTTCPNAEIESKILGGLAGKASFYVRNKMLFMVCENYVTLHLRPERSLDSILKVIDDENAPKNDINFSKAPDGTILVNAPIQDGKLNLITPCKKTTAPESTKKGAAIITTFTPLEKNAIFVKMVLSKKPHPTPNMFYATIYYKNGIKKEVEIRDGINN